MRHDLPTGLCDDTSKWADFLLAYSAVIEDGTLTANLTWVQGARFKRGGNSPFADPPHLPFEMVWVVRLKKP